MREQITDFSGEHDFLSNFYPNDQTSLEHQYQAMKATTEEDRWFVLDAATPKQAKARGNQIKCRKDWEQMKVRIMRRLLWLKFQNPELRRKLIRTGDARLVEGNWWGDVYWGVCGGVGKNMLGKLLMELRDILRRER